MKGMEEFLSVCMQDQHQCRIQFNVMLFQEKAKSLYEDLKNGEESEVASFNVGHIWFHRFKARANIHKVNVSGKAEIVDMVAASEIPETEIG